MEWRRVAPSLNGQDGVSPSAMLRRLILATSISALAGSSIRAANDEWPQFRGPTGEGISEAKNVPVQWSADANIAWKVEVPGKGWSSPVLSHGKLYLTSAVTEAEGAVSLHALCFDAATGKTLWDTEVIKPDPAAVAKMHQKNSPASATPIVTDDRLYVHFGHMGTAALDLTGKVVWKQTELAYSPVHGNGGSPLLVDGLLVFGCDGDSDPLLAALDAKTGEVRWKTPRNSPAKKHFSFCTPQAIQVDGQTEIISPCSGFVGGYGLDGHEIWRVRYGEGYSVVPRPVYSHGLLFISSGFDSPVLYAINPTGAKEDATDTKIAWTQRKGAPCTPSTLAVGDDLYFVSDGGIATCADIKTGQTHWTERLGGGFSASPFLAEGRVYFLNESGVSFVINAAETYQLLAKNDLGERALASCVPVDGGLYIRTDSHLWKVGK